MWCNCGPDCEQLCCLCFCHDGPFDADELGLDPEEDSARGRKSLNQRAAENLIRRPRYPGEIVHE